ncbi:unnamed protein product [Paramecium primaurelia]|nr:unnamed protein product [Paramecium primaurelia]
MLEEETCQHTKLMSHCHQIFKYIYNCYSIQQQHTSLRILKNEKYLIKNTKIVNLLAINFIQKIIGNKSIYDPKSHPFSRNLIRQIIKLQEPQKKFYLLYQLKIHRLRTYNMEEKENQNLNFVEQFNIKSNDLFIDHQIQYQQKKKIGAI